MNNRAYIISIDDFKKRIPGYNPAKAEEFHSQSAKIADKEFEKALKFSKYRRVILISGGSASGKTELIASQLFDEDAIIFDSTLSSEIGAKIKINKAQKAKKKIEVVAVIPDDLRRAFLAFLSRDRKFGQEHFLRTHSGSRKVLLWIAKNHPEVRMRIFISTYKSGNLKYLQPIYKPDENIKILEDLQISEAEIEMIIK